MNETMGFLGLRTGVQKSPGFSFLPVVTGPVDAVDVPICTPPLGSLQPLGPSQIFPREPMVIRSAQFPLVNGKSVCTVSDRKPFF